MKTNGDVIMVMYPNATIKESIPLLNLRPHHDYIKTLKMELNGMTVAFFQDEWWNSPYRKDKP